MGFPLPDLILESIIRDGLANAKNDPEVVEDVFSPLTQPYAEKKYGMKEVNKINKLIRNERISVVHTWHAVSAKIPCISLQLADNAQDVSNSFLADNGHAFDVPFDTPQQQAGRTIISGIDPTAYNPATGIISLPDSVNLSSIHVNLLFVDAAGGEFPILGGINNTIGSKQIMIDQDQTVSLDPGAKISSSIDFDRYSQGALPEKFTIVIGVHANEPLTTKYLYTLIKYFIVSRKDDLCSRGVQIPTFSGSDFNRNMEYGADQVYTRFLNVSGVIYSNWRGDKAQLIDNVQVNVQVPKDKYGNKILGLEESSVQVNDDD